eukprot:767719-Hanusia_phi.AAC.1
MQVVRSMYRNEVCCNRPPSLFISVTPATGGQSFLSPGSSSQGCEEKCTGDRSLNIREDGTRNMAAVGVDVDSLS